MNSNYKFHIINQAKTNYNLSYNDYFPYGMLVPKCNYSNPVYRYGFQSQEKDNEIKGIGNSVNYKFRMHDPRVGRFFAVDPLAAKYPWHTPYQFSGNKVIAFVELEGLEEFPTTIVKKIENEISGNARKRSVSIWLPESWVWGDNCINLFNRIIKNVLFDKKQATGSQIVGKNSTHVKLKNSNRASGVLTFYFNDKKNKRATDNRTAFKLSKSIGKYIEKHYDKEKGGVKVYGLTVLNGYHSMLITYGKNKEGKYEFNLFDQGPATNYWDGQSTFSSAEDLDNAINKYVRNHQDKKTNSGNYFPATAEIFLIINDKKARDENEK